MAFRTRSAIPQEAYKVLRLAAAQLKLNAQGMRANLAADNASFDYLGQVYTVLTRAQAQFNVLKTTPGLADYAKAQESDPDYDIAVEFAAMQAAIAQALAWMDAQAPVTASLRPPSQWADGVIADLFTPEQTTGLRTRLDAISSTID